MVGILLWLSTVVGIKAQTPLMLPNAFSSLSFTAADGASQNVDAGPPNNVIMHNGTLDSGLASSGIASGTNVMTVGGSADSNFVQSASAAYDAETTYYVGLVGPGTGPIEVNFYTYGSTEAYGGYSLTGGTVDAFASVQLLALTPSSNPLANQATPVSGFGDSTGSYSAVLNLDLNSVLRNGSFTPVGPNFNQSGSILMTPGLTYKVRMQAEGTVSVTGTAPADHPYNYLLVTASVDPSFSIDPSNPDASEYSIEYSPNINSSTIPAPVPEPPTWGLVGCGAVGLVGNLMLKRRRNRVRASSV
jgi:hypothetical protein